MSRTTALALAFIAQIGLAHAQECVSLPNGGVLCEQEGAVYLVDPASGAVVDVTQEVIAAMAGGGWTPESAAEPEPQGGTFEDRLAGICADGGCPSGHSGAIDDITGYIPSYQ